MAVAKGCALSGRHPGGQARSCTADDAKFLRVDSAELHLEVRGANRFAPVLLWLHGEPGGAERPLFRYYNSDLEDHLVVVYLDQRGAGRSFDEQADPDLLTVARHLADLDSVVNHLRQTFKQDRIVLVGHSWGTVLGTLYAREHPKKVSVSTRSCPRAKRAGSRRNSDFSVFII